MPPTLTLCVPEDVVTFFLRSLARAVGGTTIGWASVRAAMASEGAAGPRAVNSGLPPKATFHLDGVPLAIERASLPGPILPDPEAVTGSLYAVLEARGCRPVRAVQRISAANLGPRDAELLGVAPGVAGLRIERVSYLPSGRVVEFTRSLYRGDAYDFAAELQIGPEDEGPRA